MNPFYTDTLSNGIKVITRQNPNTPRISINLCIASGAKYERLPGTSNLLSRLLLQGTKSRTAEEIANELDSNAIELGAESKQDYLRIRALFLNEDFETAIDLFEGKFPKEGQIKTKKVDPFKIITQGLMPPLLNFSAQEGVTAWWEGYVRTYLERDLRQISQVSSLTDFKRVMEFVALRSGQLFHKADVSRDSGVSQPSVHRYINLLETTCVLHRLPAFARNRTKRLVKSPKFYWIDPGLAAYLAGYFDVDSVRQARENGGFMETLILHHLRVLGQLLVPKPAISYWRTTYGHEVDFILERGRQLVAMEVKLSTSARHRDCEGLKLFLKEYPETSCAVLVYAGGEIKQLDKRIVALPWTLLCGHEQ